MRKKSRKKRTIWKKRVWKERINYAILSSLLLIVFVGSIYCRCVEMNKLRAEQAPSEKIEQGVEQEVSAKNQIGEESQVNQTSVSNSDEPNAPDDPRAGFAVNPDIPCGAYSENDEKIVYLTFDDGPSELTQQVLDILDKYQAKATFFVTNNSPDYAGMIKTAYDKGHTIGLHTSSHDYNVLYASQEAYFADLDAIARTVQEQIGYVPCFIRFPGGTSNTIVSSISQRLMQELIREVRNRGYQYYDWNWSSGDGGVHATDELVNQANQCLENNIVLLCHDSANKQSTVDALPKIIEHYQSQGYQFKAIDRDSYVAHHMNEETL